MLVQAGFGHDIVFFSRSAQKFSENKSNLKHLVRAAPVTERSLSLDYLTAVPGVGSSPALLAGVPCGFSRGSFCFRPPTDWPVSYEMR